MGLGPEDAAQRRPLKEYEGEFGDSSAFTYGALRSMMIAYVPDWAQAHRPVRLRSAVLVGPVLSGRPRRKC
jgi:hypothetical protein